MQTSPRSSIPRPPRWLPATLALPLLLGLDGPDPDAVGILTERATVLRALAEGTVSSGQFTRSGRAALDRTLTRAEDALAAGDWLASLRPLADASEALAQSAVTFATGPIEDMDALAVESSALRAELDGLGSPRAGSAGRPAVLQALLEHATSAARAYLASSAEQGREAGVRAGIYYLKIARERAELARLLARLEGRPPAEPLATVPGLLAYLDGLEAELLALYQPPLTQDRHATFIQLSAGLKFARELADQGLALGALDRGLEVARGLALFSRPPAPEPAALWQELAGRRAEIRELDGDASLAIAWLEDARFELETPDGDRADVAAILDRVLGDYLACLETPAGAPAAIATQVTVTLVRWPFT